MSKVKANTLNFNICKYLYMLSSCYMYHNCIKLQMHFVSLYYFNNIKINLYVHHQIPRYICCVTTYQQFQEFDCSFRDSKLQIYKFTESQLIANPRIELISIFTITNIKAHQQTKSQFQQPRISNFHFSLLIHPYKNKIIWAHAQL